MKDPERLTVHDTTAFERRLLEGAKTERIPADMSARMGQVLNLGPAGAAGTAAASASAKTGVALWIVGTATVAALIGGAIGHRRSQVTPPTETPPPATSPRPLVLETAAAKAAEAAPIAAPPTTRREVAKTAAPDLRDEIVMVDAARAALAAGAPERALAVVQRYTRRYPRGTFAPEVLTLRIEALVQTGDDAAARPLGRQFLARHPDSPLAERVERLLAERR